MPTKPADRERFCIGDSDVLTLADYALRIEAHFTAAAGHDVPMDIEWAKDGIDGDLYVVQARPETVASQRRVGTFETFTLKWILLSHKTVVILKRELRIDRDYFIFNMHHCINNNRTSLACKEESERETFIIIRPYTYRLNDCRLYMLYIHKKEATKSARNDETNTRLIEL